MAVEAQLYTENHGFSSGGGGGGYSPQDLLMMESLNLQQNQQQIQFIHQLQNMHQQNNPPENGFLLPENTPSLMVFNQSPAAAAPPLMKKQRLDIDGLINFQSERLRWALQEQRKQQLALLLRKYESETQILFRQKDEEMAKAVKRRMELEDFLVKMETENQIWQRVAKENEAIIITLHNTIDQLRENAALCNNGAGDAESCCDFVAEEKILNLEQEEEEERRRKVICKSCNSRNSCVILLPCRHLCCCQFCEAYIDSCPVCKMAKKGSIEALI